MGMPTGTGAGAGGAEGGGAGGGGGAAGLGTLKDGVNSFALTLRVKGLALGLSVNFLAGAAGLAASAGFSALLAGADAGEDVGGGAGVGAARALEAAASSPSAGLLEPCPPMCMRTRIGSAICRTCHPTSLPSTAITRHIHPLNVFTVILLASSRGASQSTIGNCASSIPDRCDHHAHS